MHVLDVGNVPAVGNLNPPVIGQHFTTGIEAGDENYEWQPTIQDLPTSKNPRPKDTGNWFYDFFNGLGDAIGYWSDDNGSHEAVYPSGSNTKLGISDVHNADDMLTYLKQNLSSETLDYLVNYYLSEQSNVNRYQRELEADSSKYQRAVEDLKKAGLNPWLALSGISGSSVSSGSTSYGSNSFTSRSNNQTTNQTNQENTLLRVLGTIAVAIFGAVMAAA